MDGENQRRVPEEAGGGALERHLTQAGQLGALARALALPGDDPEDLAQDAFLALHGPDRQQRPTAYLRGVLRNLAFRSFRANHRRRRREQDFAGVNARAEPSPDQELERMELYGRLAGHVASLPPAQAEAVTLRYFDGLSVAQIAERRGVSPGSVRSTLARALGTLRERLDRSEGGRESWLSVVGGSCSELRDCKPRSLAGGGLVAATLTGAAVLVAMSPDGPTTPGAGQGDLHPSGATEVAGLELPEVPSQPKAREVRGAPAHAAHDAPVTAKALPAPGALSDPAAEPDGPTLQGRLLDANLGTGVGDLRITLIAHGLDVDGKSPQASALSDRDGWFSVPATLFGADKYTVLVDDRFGGGKGGVHLFDLEQPFSEPIRLPVGPEFLLSPETSARLREWRRVTWTLRRAAGQRVREVSASISRPGFERVRFTWPFIESDGEEPTPKRGGPWVLEARGPDGGAVGGATVTRNLGFEPVPLDLRFEDRGPDDVGAPKAIAFPPDGFPRIEPLVRKHPLRVTVVDADTGQELPPGLVQIMGRSCWKVSPTTSLEVPPGRDPYVVTVLRKGYRMAAARVAGDTKEVTIRLHRSTKQVVPVRVVDAQDFAPVEGAWVHVDGAPVGRTDPCGMVWIGRDLWHGDIEVGRGNPGLRVLSRHLGSPAGEAIGIPYIVERRR